MIPERVTISSSHSWLSCSLQVYEAMSRLSRFHVHLSHCLLLGACPGSVVACHTAYYLGSCPGSMFTYFLGGCPGSMVTCHTAITWEAVRVPCISINWEAIQVPLLPNYYLHNTIIFNHLLPSLITFTLMSVTFLYHLFYASLKSKPYSSSTNISSIISII